MIEMAYIVIYSRHSGAYGFGEPLRVLWQVPVAVAQQVCSDPRTCGQDFFLGWTRAEGQRIRWVRDDGRFDDVLADLGLVKRPLPGGGVTLKEE